jgi:N12 class adenine-specific DNA methylase
MTVELDNQRIDYIDTIIGDADKIGEKTESVSFKGVESITEFVDRIFKAVTGKTIKEHNKEIAPKENTDYLDPQSDYGSQTASIKERKKINAECKEIIARVKGNPSLLTNEDRAMLRQYSGKGGLKEGTVHEYYTPAFTAQGIFDGLAEMGFTTGNLLDPSTGSGAFADAKPKSMICTGAEIDETSSQVNQLLHPEDKVHHMAFEDLCNATPDNTFDGCATNIPWGNNIRGENKHKDPDYKGEPSIEKYFIHRMIDKVKYGGLVALCAPPRVVDRLSDWVDFRAAISRKAEFLGAHMLPSGMSKKQGTDTVWIVVVLKKHSKEMFDLIADLPNEALFEHKVLWDTFINGKWFQKDGKRFIHGTYIPKTLTGGQFGTGEEQKVTTNFTDMQLKRKLAAKFESRIDWAALKLEPPVVPNYAEGDTRYINRIQYELQGGVWIKVEKDAANTILLDESAFGAKTERGLFANCATMDGALKMSFEQANRAHGKYGEAGIITGIQKKAMDKAKEASMEFQEQIYRYNIIGKMCQSLLTKAIQGKDSEIEREQVKELVAAEINKYGHPYNNKKLMKAGGSSHEFMAFCSAFNEKGEANGLLTGDVESIKDRLQYNSNDVTSIVEHLVHREGSMSVELDDLNRLYTGDSKFGSVEDLAHIENIAITPDGILMPIHKYCSGNINQKIAKLTEAIAGTTDERLKKKFQAQIDLMEQKRKKTPIEDISFSARHKWIDKDLMREFLKAQGIPAKFGYYEKVIYNEGTDREREVEEWKSDDSRKDGIWKADENKMTYKMEQSPYAQFIRFMNNQKLKAASVPKDATAEQRDQIKAESLKKDQEFVDKMEEEFQAFLESHPKADSIERAYNFKFNNNVPYEYSCEPLGLDDLPKWLIPHDYQNQEVRRLSEEGNGICGYNVGLGKAEPLDAKVLTPSGWVRMGDISVGDYVIAVDGNPTKVLGVFPQGEKEIYQVKFHDGAKTECCKEHLWHTKTQLERDQHKPGDVRELSAIMESLKYRTSKNHSIPMVGPVQFNSQTIPINPYILGVLLGDGSLANKNGVQFTSPDKQIIDTVAQLLPGTCKVSVIKSKSSCKTYGIVRKNQTQGTNQVLDSLRDLELSGKKSYTKFIPDIYKFNSFDVRYAIFQGLMDTDGYVDKKGVTVQFSSSSKQLAEDVQFLVQSFGGNATIKSKIPTFMYKGEKKTGALHYTVHLRLPPDIHPFQLKKKAERVKPKSKYQPIRYITSVEYIGEKQAQCIMVEHPEHLYVTDDFIVTHNTMSALLLAKYNSKMGRSKRTCIVVPKSVTSNWYHEAKTVYGSLDHALFIGVSPEFDKKGNIKQEKVLDDQGKAKFVIDEKTQETKYQYKDKLKSDDKPVWLKKFWSIPTTNASLIVITMPHFEAIPMRAETRKDYMDEQVARNSMGHSDALKFLYGKQDASVLQGIKNDRADYADLVNEGKDKGDKDRVAKGVSYQDAASNERFEELLSRETKRKEELPYWEDLGFSSVIIDESHTYKNSFKGSSGLADVEFMPKYDSAAGAMTATAKMHYTRKTNNGRGSYCLSATPVTNSPMEIWNSLALCTDNEMLDQYGIHNPDDFLSQFCKYGVAEKTRLSGEKATVQAMVGFTNLGALRGIYGSIANVKDAQDVNLPLPAHDSKSEIVTMTSEQSGIYSQLQVEAKEAAQKKQTGKIMSIMRKMEAITGDPDLYFKRCTFQFRLEDSEKVEALIEDLPINIEYIIMEPREISPGVYGTKLNKKTGKMEIIKDPVTYYLEKSNIVVTPSEKSLKVVVPATPASIGKTYETPVSDRLKKFGINEGDVSHNVPPKYAKLLENIRSGYDVDIDGTVKNVNGKHIVFTQEKSNHNKIARILANGLGIDRKKICIINADTCSNNAKTNAITEGFNAGRTTIAICNKKAEVGLNLQKGTSQIHHLDYRWTPASLTQADGRGIRQGNDSEFVRSSKYLAEGSADAFKLQILEKKAGWINNLLKGDEETIESDQSDKDDMIMEMLAALSGNAEEFYETERKKKEKEVEAKRAKKVRGYSNALAQIQHVSRYLNNGGEAQEKEIEKVKLETQNEADQIKWDEYLAKDISNKEKLALMLEELQSEGVKIKEFEELSQTEFDKIKKIPSGERTLEQKYKLRASKMIGRAFTADRLEEYYGRTIKGRKKQIGNLDDKYARIRKEKEDLLRMKKGALRKAKPEDLPFDISILDNPENTLVTQQGVAWELGKTFVLDNDGTTQIVKVTDVDLKEQKIKYEYLLGGGGDGSWSVMELNTMVAKQGPKPCTMSEDEINLKRMLQEGILYEEIPDKLSREAFVENMGEIQVYGNPIYENESGEIKTRSYGSYQKVNAKELNILYPDIKNEAFKSSVFKAYLETARGNKSDGPTFSSLRNIFNLSDYTELEALAAEYGVKVPESEIRQGVADEWEEAFKQAEERLGLTKEIYQAALNRLSSDNIAESLIRRTKDKGDNRADMIRIANEYIESKKVEYGKELDAQKNAEKESFKKHPDYIEPPASAVSTLRGLGIEVVANFATVHNRGSYEPFSRWWLNETDKTVNYKNTTLYKNRPLLKDDYRAKYFQGEVNGKDGNWWHFPSSRDLDDFVNELRT